MGYVMRASVKSVAQHKMIDTMAKYNTSKDIQYVWDGLQRNVMHNRKLQKSLFSRAIFRPYLQKKKIMRSWAYPQVIHELNNIL